jgi:Ca2+-binding RTX toxin-like protein
MSGSRRAAALVAGLAAALSVPVAQAAEGTDSATRGNYVTYTADSGEANHFVAETSDVGLHLHDSGAIIRWTSGSECTASGHDVNCVDRAGGFLLNVRLGDRADTFVNNSRWAAEVHLGPGNDRAVGGGVAYLLDGGRGADDLHGGPVTREPHAFIGQAVTYASSKRRVRATADNRANDGARGEHDNVHTDVHEVDGSRYGDRISGFAVAFGDKGNDVLKGRRGRDSLDGRRGNDVLVGRGGRDTLVDYWGNNTFRARDHTIDHIGCGKGHDIVYADRRDVIESPPSQSIGGACDDVRRR